MTIPVFTFILSVPARISLGVLTVLTLTTQCVGVWMGLPRVSYIKVGPYTFCRVLTILIKVDHYGITLRWVLVVYLLLLP